MFIHCIALSLTWSQVQNEAMFLAICTICACACNNKSMDCVRVCVHSLKYKIATMHMSSVDICTC